MPALIFRSGSPGRSSGDKPSARRGRLDAAHLVGRIILDPPIESLNPFTPRHVRVSTPTSVGAASAGAVSPRTPAPKFQTCSLSAAASEMPPLPKHPLHLKTIYGACVACRYMNFF